MGSLSLWPGDSLTAPRAALSVGFIHLVSSMNATQATGLLTIAPVGLPPTEHASLRWTHSFAKNGSADMSLCGNAFISVMETTYLRDFDNSPGARDGSRKGTLLVECQVGSGPVIVTEIQT